MKRHIFVTSITLAAALISSSWNSLAQAQNSGFERSGRRAEWQQRVQQDTNPTVMTPEAAFGDQPTLMVERDWNLSPVPEEEGNVVVDPTPSVLDPVVEQEVGGEYPHGSSSCSTCNDGADYGCADCGCEECGCGTVCTDSCTCCCCPRLFCGLLFPHVLSPLMQRTEFFGGVHGFKGPVDQGSNGNFGFHGGFNFSGPLGGPHESGYQLGMNIVGSDYSGSSILGDDSGDRKQIFFTGGLFHRSLNGGMQGGIVYDFLQDTFYFGKANVGQVRAEVSWGQCGYQEVGFWGAFRAKSDEATRTIGEQTYIWEVKPTNLYAFFYRRNFCEGAEARLWGGFTGNSDGMVGADMRIPLRKSMALENSFNYLIPKQGRGETGTTEESWSLVMNLVWYPGRSASGVSCDPFRPFFGVGNNSVFMTDLQ